jgi:hypothetical protein
MKRLRIKEKSSFCIDCEYVFDEIKKYHSRDRCNPCYQKLYIKGKLGIIRKEIETNCSLCGNEYGGLNSKGRAVMKGSHGLCKTCYCRSRKPKKECINCGNMMISGSNTGLCIVCKELKRSETAKRGWKRKVKPLPYVDPETYETIRRVLVRFKFGNNNLVDNFRVVDAYVDLCENPVFLDTLTEEAQVVEMLRYLKKVYDFNKEGRIANLAIAQKKAEFKKKYYKYKKKEKTVNKTADMKTYMKEYKEKYRLLGKRD